MSDAVLVDDTFGTLTWNEELGWWSGSAELADDYRVDVYVESTLHHGDQRDRDLARARRLWEIMSKFDEELRQKAAEDEFCEMYAEWRVGVDPPAPALDLLAFVDKFKLQSVTFYSEGGAELFLDDALDVFGGHALHFTVDSDGNYENGSAALSG